MEENISKAKKKAPAPEKNDEKLEEKPSRKGVQWGDDVQEVEQKKTRKTVYPSGPQFAPPEPVPERLSTKSRATETENKEPWDRAYVEATITDFKMPSPWPHRWRIIWHHVFNVLMFILSLLASTFQYISFAVICYNLNIYGMNKQQVTNTYSCTCSGVVSENDYSPNCNQQVIYERSAWYAVIVLIFPEIWCIFYSFYFVVFKKVEWPSAGQFALLLGMETLSAFGSALMMLIVAPYISKTLAIALMTLPTVIPIIVQFFSKSGL